MSYFDRTAAFGRQTRTCCDSTCRRVCPGAWSDKHKHSCIQGCPSSSVRLCHSATPTAVRVLSLHPPPLIPKGQASSPCQMEFIHSCSPADVILTKSTVRVGERRALVKITSPGFLCFSSFRSDFPPVSPSGCVSPFYVSFCCTLCINVCIHTSRHGFLHCSSACLYF